MRVLHVNYNTAAGGAALASQRLHRALVAVGIDSRYCAFRGTTGGDERLQIYASPGKLLLNQITNRGLQTLNRIGPGDATSRAINIVPSGLGRYLAAADADVIHLHWVKAETLSIAELGRLRKPIVWTLHDMWPLCGAENYLDTDAYVTGYPRCSVSGWVHRRKQRHWAGLNLAGVGPSAWMTDCARRSLLMRDRPIEHIFNCVDTDLFRPMDRQSARRTLGLPVDGRVVCFGADGVRTSRKGFDLLEPTLARLDAADLTLAVFGDQGRTDVAGIPTKWLGFVDGEEALARVYSAADVLVVPSRQDNLPNTCVEALSCGTPVVAFRVGGMSELVVHGRDGYLAEPFDVVDLARGIEWVLEGGPISGGKAEDGAVARDGGAHADLLRSQARERALKCFSPSVVAAHYIALYQRVLAKREL